MPQTPATPTSELSDSAERAECQPPRRGLPPPPSALDQMALGHCISQALAESGDAAGDAEADAEPAGSKEVVGTALPVGGAIGGSLARHPEIVLGAGEAPVCPDADDAKESNPSDLADQGNDRASAQCDLEDLGGPASAKLGRSGRGPRGARIGEEADLTESGDHCGADTAAAPSSPRKEEREGLVEGPANELRLDTWPPVNASTELRDVCQLPSIVTNLAEIAFDNRCGDRFPAKKSCPEERLLISMGSDGAEAAEAASEAPAGPPAAAAAGAGASPSWCFGFAAKDGLAEPGLLPA